MSFVLASAGAKNLSPARDTDNANVGAAYSGSKTNPGANSRLLGCVKWVGDETHTLVVIPNRIHIIKLSSSTGILWMVFNLIR